jgi:hypothetical protein
MVWCCCPIKNLIEISLPALHFVYFEIATYLSTLKYVININWSILATSKNYKWSLSLAAASRVHPFCNLQSWALTHAVWVLGLYELLGNPST